MIEYYTSTFNPDVYFAAMDGVIVAHFYKTRWIDRSIYRPVRDHYIKAEWNGIPYDPSLLLEQEEFEIVRDTGREAPL